MRFALLSSVMIRFGLACLMAAWPLVTQAYDIENQHLFPAPGPETRVLRVISTADLDLFEPYIRSFQANAPGVSVDYISLGSRDLMEAMQTASAQFDVAISSAMDLQTKLANDGLVRPHRSDATQSVPDWGRWRDHLFAFTLEPAAIVLSRRAFKGLPLPQTRQQLISLLRDNPDRFNGRIGTYDVRDSGLGFLFATQDARTSETFWRLAEVMGGLNTRLYCCSGDMIDDVVSDEIAVAYNVLGSYAKARVEGSDNLVIVSPRDFTTVMMRTVLISAKAPDPDAAGQFVDHLLVQAWGRDADRDRALPFPPVDPGILDQDTALRPIRLGPGLLVYLDRLKKRSFLAEWENAILQK